MNGLPYHPTFSFRISFIQFKCIAKSFIKLDVFICEPLHQTSLHLQCTLQAYGLVAPVSVEDKQMTGFISCTLITYAAVDDGCTHPVAQCMFLSLFLRSFYSKANHPFIRFVIYALVFIGEMLSGTASGVLPLTRHTK